MWCCVGTCCQEPCLSAAAVFAFTIHISTISLLRFDLAPIFDDIKLRCSQRISEHGLGGIPTVSARSEHSAIPDSKDADTIRVCEYFSREAVPALDLQFDRDLLFLLSWAIHNTYNVQMRDLSLKMLHGKGLLNSV